MMAPILTMREALDRPDYFGSQLLGDTWANWRVLLIAIAGEPLTASELLLFQVLTNRQKPPSGAPREFFGVMAEKAALWPSWPRG